MKPENLIAVLLAAARRMDAPDTAVPGTHASSVQDIDAMVAFLRRAADSLQDYCAEANGDMNDSLAMEIYRYLGAE